MNQHSHSIIEKSSIASISLVASSCPLSTGVLVALIVVGVMLLASLIGNAILTVVVLQKRRYTSKRCLKITVMITLCIYIMM